MDMFLQRPVEIPLPEGFGQGMCILMCITGVVSLQSLFRVLQGHSASSYHFKRLIEVLKCFKVSC